MLFGTIQCKSQDYAVVIILTSLMQMKRTYFISLVVFVIHLHFVKIIRTFKPVVVILLRQLFYLPIVQFTTAGQLITAAVVKHDTFSLDIGIEISVLSMALFKSSMLSSINCTVVDAYLFFPL